MNEYLNHAAKMWKRDRQVGNKSGSRILEGGESLGKLKAEISGVYVPSHAGARRSGGMSLRKFFKIDAEILQFRDIST